MMVIISNIASLIWDSESHMQHQVRLMMPSSLSGNERKRENNRMYEMQQCSLYIILLLVMNLYSTATDPCYNYIQTIFKSNSNIFNLSIFLH